jgi:hypothetical protein
MGADTTAVAGIMVAGVTTAVITTVAVHGAAGKEFGEETH